MLELTAKGTDVWSDPSRKISLPKFKATLIGDSHQIFEAAKSFEVTLEDSMLAEVGGQIIVFKFRDIPLPEKQEDRTPIKILHTLFKSPEVGYFTVMCHLRDLQHVGDLGTYEFQGNYNTVNQIEEERARSMFPHLFNQEEQEPCQITNK